MDKIKNSTILSGIIWGMVAIIVIISAMSLGLTARSDEITTEVSMDYNELTDEEKRVILHKGTEAPNSGTYLNNKSEGVYTCKQCDAELYRSADKFDSHCGWPSFDDEISGAIKRTVDADGSRTEITCVNCGGHLGHVFDGEHFTDKNIRHCVNSISLNFVPADQKIDIRKAYFAGGCFWGIEHLLNQKDGVISARSGYMGGKKLNPTYQEVSYNNTGHAEAVEVEFDASITNFETLARYFFEIHDPTQIDRQGPDVGDQYRSVIFYVDDEQKVTSEKLIDILKSKGFDVATELEEFKEFWVAEDYHQGYYTQNGKEPYCHFYQKRF